MICCYILFVLLLHFAKSQNCFKIFKSKQQYMGNFGGIAAADAICQNEAMTGVASLQAIAQSTEVTFDKFRHFSFCFSDKKFSLFITV